MSDTWFTAKCLYRSVHRGDEPPAEILGEVRFFLLKASDEPNAKEKAFAIASGEEHSYQNSFDVTVHWKLECVLDVKEVLGLELKDGLEVYYEYVTEAEMGALNRPGQNRA